MFDAYPLSFSQNSLWLISQSGVDNGAYNLYLSIKINSSIDIHNIEKIIHGAASKIVRTHSQLRSNYILKDDEPPLLRAINPTAIPAGGTWGTVRGIINTNFSNINGTLDSIEHNIDVHDDSLTEHRICLLYTSPSPRDS